MILDGAERLADRIEDGVVADHLVGMAQEVGDAPAGGLHGSGLAHPAQLLLEPPGDGGEQGGGFQFGQGLGLRLGHLGLGPLQNGPAQRLG